MKPIFTFYIFLLTQFCQAQSKILLIPDADCQVTIDGEITEQLTKGKPKKFELTFGEHYIQASSSSQEISKSIMLNEEKQKIIKLNFPLLENTKELGNTPLQNPDILSPILIAELDMKLLGGVYDLADESITPSDHSKLYYAFEAGDEILINADIKNKKGKFHIKVKSYPDNSTIYSKRKLRDLKDHKIKIRKRGIYTLDIGTSAVFDKKIKLKIERLPANQEAIDFNTTVVKKYKFETIQIEKSAHYVNGTANETIKGGTNEVSIPIKIPKGTLEWYYSFSASRNKAQVRANLKQVGLLGKITKALAGADPTTTIINIGMNLLAAPPGADYCNVYLMTHPNKQLFERDRTFYYITEGSRKNLKSSTIKLNCCMDQPYYLGIENRSTLHGIHVGLEVVAIKRVSYLEREVQ